MALGNREVSWLTEISGLPDSTVRDALKRGPARADAAVKLSRALKVSVDWLLTGSEAARRIPDRGSDILVDADNADFVGLPRYDLTKLTEAGKGNRIETMPFRRDWLNRRIGTTAGLWLAELPSGYDELLLQEGDVVICSDIPRDQTPPDNTTCLFLGNGLFVARYRNYWTYDPGDTAGPRVGPKDLVEGTQPIARIRARVLARV